MFVRFFFYNISRISRQKRTSLASRSKTFSLLFTLVEVVAAAAAAAAAAVVVDIMKLSEKNTSIRI